MADRVVVMNQGRIEQVGTPQNIYREPASAFVADFIGKVNVLSATAEGGGRFRVGAMMLDCASAFSGVPAGTSVKLYLRPEDVQVERRSGRPRQRRGGVGAEDRIPRRVLPRHRAADRYLRAAARRQRVAAGVRPPGDWRRRVAVGWPAARVHARAGLTARDHARTRRDSGSAPGGADRPRAAACERPAAARMRGARRVPARPAGRDPREKRANSRRRLRRPRAFPRIRAVAGADAVGGNTVGSQPSSR